jgi:hypothetical protein
MIGMCSCVCVCVCVCVCLCVVNVRASVAMRALRRKVVRRVQSPLVGFDLGE